MRSGGANATNAAAYALGRELRRIRADRGITPKELSSALGTARNKLDALELGELGSPRSKKRAGRVSRAEAIALLLFPPLAIPTDTADALLVLAHEAGAMSRADVYEPITPAELRAHGRQPVDRSSRRSTIAEAVSSLLAAHPFVGSDQMTHAETARASPVWEVPAPRCSIFAGRDDDLVALRRALVSDGPGVIVVNGAGGTGKSELVRAAIDDPRVRQHFHACVWITAREHEFLGRATLPSMSTIDALAEIASHLAVAPGRLADVLTAIRILVVVDNAEALADEDGVISRLGRMVRESKVIVTSRNRSAASFVLPFPPHGPLEGLRTHEAVALLEHEMATRGGGRTDPRSLEHIARVVGGAPLALHWIAGRTPAESLPELAHALESGGARELYGFMFGRAWDQLPAGARRLMSVLAYETIDPVAPQLLAELDGSRASSRAAVAALSDASIVEAAGSAAAVSLHPLARSFVRSRTRAPAGRDRRSAKALEYLVRSLADDSRGSGAAEPLGGLRNHLRWMEAVLQVDPVLVMIAWTKLSRYLWEHWHWHLYEQCTRIGAAAAREIGRTRHAAGALLRALTELDLTYLRFEQGRLDEALAIGERARAVFEELGDDAGLCLVHRYIGLVLMENGDARSMAAARTSFRRALEAIARARRWGFPRRSAKIQTAAKQLRHGLWDVIRGGYGPYRGAWAPSEAEIHTLLGDHAVQQGDVTGAVPILEKAVHLYERADGRWPGSEGAPILALGGCYEKLGRMPDAERMYARAMEIAAATDRLDLRGAALLRLARVHAASSPRDALEQARAAKAIFDRLGQTKAAAEATALLSRSTAAPV